MSSLLYTHDPYSVAEQHPLPTNALLPFPSQDTFVSNENEKENHSICHHLPSSSPEFNFNHFGVVRGTVLNLAPLEHLSSSSNGTSDVMVDEISVDPTSNEIGISFSSGHLPNDSLSLFEQFLLSCQSLEFCETNHDEIKAWANTIHQEALTLPTECRQRAHSMAIWMMYIHPMAQELIKQTLLDCIIHVCTVDLPQRDEEIKFLKRTQTTNLLFTAYLFLHGVIEQTQMLRILETMMVHLRKKTESSSIDNLRNVSLCVEMHIRLLFLIWKKLDSDSGEHFVDEVLFELLTIVGGQSKATQGMVVNLICAREKIRIWSNSVEGNGSPSNFPLRYPRRKWGRK